MKALLMFILGIALFFNASAQNDSLKIEKEKLITHTNYFGIAAGLTNGLGFSYIYWPKSFGVQLTALPIYIDEEFIYSAGLTFLYELKKFKYLRLYVYMGNHLSNIFLSYYRFHVNTGIGPGLETGNDSFKFHLRAGYAMYFTRLISPAYIGSDRNDFSYLPTVELGWFYNFGKK